MNRPVTQTAALATEGIMEISLADMSVTEEIMETSLADMSVTHSDSQDIDKKEEEEEDIGIIAVFKPEKIFPCEMCVKTFTRRDSLKRHSKICKKGVTNTANLRCVKCGKTFSTCSNRIKHEKKSKCNKE